MTDLRTTEHQPVLSWVDGYPVVNHLAARREYDVVTAAGWDAWVVGAMGMEVPGRDATGRLGLYMWNPGTRQHGRLDLGTDIVTPE